MAYDYAFFHYSVIAYVVFPGLAVHFFNGFFRRFKIIGCGGIFFCKGIVRILYIGKVYLYFSLKSFERFNAFVAAAVINDGDGKLRFKRSEHRVCKMRRRYKVYVVSAFIYQFFIYFSEPFGRYGFSETSAAYFFVLAKNTPEITAAEKYRSAAVFAAYWRLFPKMKSGAGNSRCAAQTAKPLAVFGKGQTFCVAFSRADVTKRHF